MLETYIDTAAAGPATLQRGLRPRHRATTSWRTRRLAKLGAAGVALALLVKEYTLAPGVEGKAREVAKIEVVCRLDDVDRLLRTIVETAASGCRGDGIVFVTPVERAVKIRNGAEGPAALQL